MLTGSSSAELLEPGEHRVSSWRCTYYTKDLSDKGRSPDSMVWAPSPCLAQSQHSLSTSPLLWACCQPCYWYLILTQSLPTATNTWGSSQWTKTLHKCETERKSCFMSPSQDSGPSRAAAPHLLFLHTSKKCLPFKPAPSHGTGQGQCSCLDSEAVPSGSICVTTKENAQFLLSLPFKQLVWRGREA